MVRWNPFRRRSWIETVSKEELEREKVRVESQAQVLMREIQRLEEEKRKLFRQGVGKSTIEKLLLAERIKDVDAEIKVKLREYNRLIKQRRALANLIRLKEMEDRLREKGIWDKLARTEPDKLIQALSEVRFEELQLEKNLDKINEILGEAVEPVEVAGETKEILQLWEKVEQGELAPEEIERRLESKIKVEEEEEKPEKELERV